MFANPPGRPISIERLAQASDCVVIGKERKNKGLSDSIVQSLAGMGYNHGSCPEACNKSFEAVLLGQK